MQEAFTRAHRAMEKNYGFRPKGEPSPQDKETVGPPLWIKLIFLPIGVSVSKIWGFFNGKKTVVGALVLLVSTLAGLIPVVLPAFGVEAVLVGKIAGGALAVVGLLHKAYKYLYGEEPPTQQ